MGQRLSGVAKKDAQIISSREECAKGMEQTLKSKYAVTKVAKI